MHSFLFSSDGDIQSVRDFIRALPSPPTVVDFDEQMLLASVCETIRIWQHDDRIIGFAYVDDYNNLWFEAECDAALLEELETEIIQWGVTCIERHDTEPGARNSLDHTCSADHFHRIAVLEKHGFTPQTIRTLRYSRPLSMPIVEIPLPEGFTIRSVHGEDEVYRLVDLHRAAFGTDAMTVEQRLAMMRGTQYMREMDLVSEAPGGELAAFCVCGFADAARKTGFTDPVGTHPHWQRLGLGKTLVSTGLKMLKNAGADVAELGTSTDNYAMQGLATKLGFICVSEKMWFSKGIIRR